MPLASRLSPLASRLSLLVVCAGAVPAAWACPSPYGSASCTGTSGNVCQFAGTTWACDLTRGGSSVDADGAVVYDGSGTWCTAGTYCAFGTDAGGTDFCCETGAAGTTIDAIVLIGGGSDDKLTFTYTSGASTLELTAGVGIPLAALAYGNGGDDYMEGSNSSSPLYGESFWAGDGADLIYGNGGGDYIVGNAGEDECYGGDGADEVYGGDSADLLLGGAGNDDLLGATFPDEMSGGTGADIVDGEAGADIVCGALGADLLYGGDGDDSLWGAESADIESGDADVNDDRCSFNGTTDPSCEIDIDTDPGCPTP